MGNLLDSLFPAGSVVDRFHDAPVGNSATTLFPRQTISALPAEDPRGNWEKLNDYLVATPSPYATKQILRDMLKGVIAGPLALEKTHRGRYNNPFDPQLTADLTPLSLPLGGNALFAKPAPVLSAIRAYHGSPHVFDKFSLRHLGSGEGAQSYGIGHYLAENPKLAKYYRDKLASPVSGFEIDNVPYEQWFDKNKSVFSIPEKLRESGVNDRNWYWLLRMKNSGLSKEDFMREYKREMPTVDRILLEKLLPRVNIKPPSQGGALYEVQLQTEPEKLLDLDLPMRQQPKDVRKGVPWLAELLQYPTAWGNNKLTPTGFELTPRNRAQVESLKQAGIPGAQYFDGVSRKAGEGTRNYVIWDEDKINILKRYGLGGAAIGAGNALIPGEQ